jgi:hydroxymethylglutaryl-CoA lyase
MANVNRPISEALAMTCDVIEAAKENNIKVYAYATLAFECPFEGSVNPEQVAAIVSKYADAGVREDECEVVFGS